MEEINIDVDARESSGDNDEENQTLTNSIPRVEQIEFRQDCNRDKKRAKFADAQTQRIQDSKLWSEVVRSNAFNRRSFKIPAIQAHLYQLKEENELFESFE